MDEALQLIRALESELRALWQGGYTKEKLVKYYKVTEGLRVLLGEMRG